MDGILNIVSHTLGIHKTFKWLFRLTPFGNRYIFRRELHQLTCENNNIFYRDYNDSVFKYLDGSTATTEGSVLSSWWACSFGTLPALFFQREPDELVSILNSVIIAIKKVDKISKQAQYQQMASRFNTFCKKLEDLSKRFPNLCPGLSRIEQLPPV